jgi:hypothetical protein
MGEMNGYSPVPVKELDPGEAPDKKIPVHQ